MRPKILKTEAEYAQALEHVDMLMSAQANSIEMDDLELWVHLVEVYEEKHCPIQPLPKN